MTDDLKARLATAINEPTNKEELENLVSEAHAEIARLERWLRQQSVEHGYDVLEVLRRAEAAKAESYRLEVNNDWLYEEMSRARGQLFQGNTEAALGILGSALATDQPNEAIQNEAIQGEVGQEAYDKPAQAGEQDKDAEIAQAKELGGHYLKRAMDAEAERDDLKQKHQEKVQHIGDLEDEIEKLEAERDRLAADNERLRESQRILDDIAEALESEGFVHMANAKGVQMLRRWKKQRRRRVNSVT